MQSPFARPLVAGPAAATEAPLQRPSSAAIPPSNTSLAPAPVSNIAPAILPSSLSPAPLRTQATSFARPRAARPSTPVQPISSPMAATYWIRLSKMLQEAAALVSSLIPPAELTVDKAAKGAAGVVAVDLQGRQLIEMHEVVSQETARDPTWKQAYDLGGVGALVSYGVADPSAVWVATRLSEVCATDGWKLTSPASQLDLNTEMSSLDPAVEAVRVRVWDSEPAFLPVSLSEKLFPVRKRLHRYRNRVERCLKILSCLEGRGRKLTASSLEKAKLALEKADALHAKEEEKIREKENKERESVAKAKSKLEKKLEKSQKVKKQKVKNSVERKRRREASAEAMFMKRFVKQKPSEGISPNSSGSAAAHGTSLGDVVKGVSSNGKEANSTEHLGAVPANGDKDAMTTSWWLQSEMEAPDRSELERKFTITSHSEKGIQASADGSFRQHMHYCARRRKAAEGRIHKVLREYRANRTTHLDDRMPRFTQRRADVRGRETNGPVKLLQFHENYRPAFFGVDSRKSKTVTPTRPTLKDPDIDYTCDSGEEWEEEEDAEDLLDVEADKERADEDAELRKLYGSDEEDDDDFLDDGDADDDDDDDTSSTDGAAGEAPASEKIPHGANGLTSLETANGRPDVDSSSKDIIDLTITTSVTGNKRIAASRDASAPKLKPKKRRHRKFKSSIVIHGVSFPTPGEQSPLDCYSVSVVDNTPKIRMFDPYVTPVSDFLQETSVSKPAPVRIPQTSLDDAAKHDLAVVIVTGTTKTSRDNIVFEFCERRRSQGLTVPPKVEVVRAIRVIATNEKRVGDSRAAWHLKDRILATRIRETYAVGLPVGRKPSHTASGIIAETGLPSCNSAPQSTHESKTPVVTSSQSKSPVGIPLSTPISSHQKPASVHIRQDQFLYASSPTTE